MSTASTSSFVVSSSSSSTAVVRLAQEIFDEFLVCKICLEAYRNPKCLTCLHTFCEECIENHIASETTYKKYSDYREFTCPLCRKRTQLSVGGVKKLADNFLVSSLSELVSRQRPSRFPFCDICKQLSSKHREATSKCLDCAKLLCATCVEMHRQTKVTSGHSMFDVEIEKDVECHEHRDEAVRFYCEPCDTCVCVLCTFHDHKDHEITQFSEAVVTYKTGIVTLLQQCQSKVDQFETELESLNHCEEVIRNAEQKVHDTAIEFIQEIRNRERQLIEELHNLYGPECMDFIEGRKAVGHRMETLRSTCGLAEVILNGKDIELLLLKKDVQDKLEALNDVDVKPPPASCKKIVRFIAGSLDFGYLHDEERPLVSSVSRPRKMKWNSSLDEPDSAQEVTTSNCEAATQTEGGAEDKVEVGIQTERVRPVTSSSGSSTQKEPLQMSRPAKHFVR